MTAQVLDYCKYNDEEYVIVGKTDWVAFSPSIFGLICGRCSSAVGEGFWVGYEIRDDILLLDQLNICTKDDIYPDVCGVKAINPGYDECQMPNGNIFKSLRNDGCWIYDGLRYKFEYTGKFLLGAERIDYVKYCNYGGIDRFWKYKKLLSAEFCEGKLVNIDDVSQIGQQIWQSIEDNRENCKEYDAFTEFMFEKNAILERNEKPWWIDNWFNQ